MNMIGAFVKNTYKTPASLYNNVLQQNHNENESARKSDLRMKIRMLSQNIEDGSKSIYDELYSQSSKANKSEVKLTKTLKYSFKSISSLIMRSKTSLAAKQAVGQARREVQRLKREKQTGKYDKDEIEAAIAHAESMERVARKKVRHLLEEEMAKAGGRCDGETLNEKKEGSCDETEKINKEEPIEEDYSEKEEKASELTQMSEELFDEIADELKDILEDMELNSFMQAENDMDPEDIDAMKLKHRLKEMKEMGQADSEYLKAVFEHLESLKASGAMISAGSTMVQEAGMSVDVML